MSEDYVGMFHRVRVKVRVRVRACNPWGRYVRELCRNVP